MNDDITKDSVQIARLEERIASMDKDMRAQTDQIRELKEKLDQVILALSEAKGGWKTLMWLGGAAAAVGALVSRALEHVNIG